MAGFSVSGIGSGIDWQSILDKLNQVELQRLTPLQNEQSNANKKLTAWNDFTSRLSTLQSAAADLKYASSFNVFSASLSSSSSVSASTLVSATGSSTASKGSYQLVINSRAQSEKLASSSFSSQTNALGISGTILINGKAVQISTTDSLKNVADRINALNSGSQPIGVSAGIVQDSPSTYRLVLTSGKEGAAGISLLNGSSSDALAGLGFNGSGTTLKNQVAGAATSDAFSSSSTAVETLLGTASQNLSGTVTINGKSVAIDLSDSLDTIKDNLNAAGLSASVISETSGTTTSYRLKIEGVSSWTDQNNILQSLGVIEGKRDDVIGVSGGVANTTDGTTAITASTKITDIYGYNVNSTGDKITISGTTHSGTAVAATDLAIDANTTVGDLLTRIQNLFGDVTASVTSDGKIQVVDNATGTSQLSVNLKTTITDPNGGVLDFGTFSQAGAIRKYAIQEGKDASFSLDGMNMTSQTNTVTGAIPGVTLNLLNEDPNTTVTVNVGNDGSAIESKVKAMLAAYNDIIGYVNTQMTYNQDSKTTGGPLFGDNTLKSVKSNLQSLVLTSVGTSSINHLADVGITVGDDNKLSLDSSKFQQVLSTNFDDVVKLFTDSGTSSDSRFSLTGSGRDTRSGTYTIDISQAAGGGLNIAGKIDGWDATGSGDILSLQNGTSGANGLSISFSGTSAPASATFTFSRGIASLLESAVYNMTDPVNGSVTVQKNGTQSSIDALGKKMTAMQDNIDMKMAMLKTQFVNMDAAVAQMQNMQSYLSTQISKLS